MVQVVIEIAMFVAACERRSPRSKRFVKSLFGAEEMLEKCSERMLRAPNEWWACATRFGVVVYVL
jgi:hypothetical protein